MGMTYADNWRLRSHCVTFAWHTTCSFAVASVVTSLAFVPRLLCDTQHYLRVHTVLVEDFIGHISHPSLPLPVHQHFVNATMPIRSPCGVAPRDGSWQLLYAVVGLESGLLRKIVTSSLALVSSRGTARHVQGELTSTFSTTTSLPS